MNKTVKKKIKIVGMHCTSCAMSIDFELEDMDGITSVNTNYAQQETEVAFDEKKVSVEKIIAVIKKAGYDATLL